MPRADRLLRLVQLLSGTRFRRLGELTRELETSPRSIYRDLADLEMRGLPIERVEGAYRIAQTASVRPLPLTGRERLVLSLALENRSLDRQPAFATAIRQLRAKLTAAHALDAPPMAEAGPERSGTIPAEIAEALEESIRNRHSLSILYTSLAGRQRRWRGVDPWVVVHRCDAWYLIGRCHVHDEPRTFRVDRIGAVLPIGSAFDAPADFDPERWFDASWGVMAGGEADEIVIEFDPEVAPLIEHAQHHPSESKRRLADGTIEYRLRVAPNDDLARWICGFGGTARVAHPPTLAARVHTLASATAAAHRRCEAAMTKRAKR